MKMHSIQQFRLKINKALRKEMGKNRITEDVADSIAELIDDRLFDRLYGRQVCYRPETVHGIYLTVDRPFAVPAMLTFRLKEAIQADQPMVAVSKIRSK